MHIERRVRGLAVAALSLTILAGCGGSDPSTTCDAECDATGTAPLMDFRADQGFYAAAFPTDQRLRDDGSVALDDFPNAELTDLAHRVLTILRTETRGFGTTSGIFFALDGAIREADLPSVHASVADGSPVALVAVDPAAPDYLQHYPIEAGFLADGGPYGAPNLLVALPLQGVPLRPNERYAAVVLTTLHDAAGAPLGRAAAMTALTAKKAPEGMRDSVFKEYEAALDALAAAKIDAAQIAAMTVFTTGSPTDVFAKVTAAMIAAPAPKPDAPFARDEMFDDYCVYHTTIPMPEYQGGKPPYSSDGGEWVLDANGDPVVQRMEEANWVVTVPRRMMPPAGFPLVVFSRTGGGGDRPLVDRGVQAMTGGPAITPGTGPALEFARAGFGGSSIDGPHGGLRNITHADEQFLMFNVGNPGALRDNVRQSAAELALQAHILDDVAIDVSDCPGVVTPDGKARFDTKTLALMGHSMGATIAPLSLAFEPRFRAGLLSGAGGSWIENVIYKQEPIAVKPIAEVLIGVEGSGYSLTELDPLLSMFQWAGEPADPPVYARRIVSEPVGAAPRSVLMMQGIVDSYIMPPIANATSLSIGLDLAGDELDATNPKLAGLTPLGELLDLVGREKIPLPAADDVAKGITAVVTQHPEDGIENGHEVVFQTEPPKHEYRCFLAGLAKGLPRVPSPGKEADPCD